MAGGTAPKKVELDFGSGLAQQFDPRHAPPETALEIVNSRWTHDGALERRPGNTLVGTLSGASSGALVTRGTEIAATNATGLLQSYSAAAGGFVSRGQVAEAVVTREGLYADSNNPSSGDVAYGNGAFCFVWMSGDLWTSTLDVYCSIV